MGTRADFWVGRGLAAEWLGSVGYDGDNMPVSFFKINNETRYRQWVTKELDSRDDATVPEEGWPWPWKDSLVSDCAYSFDDNMVWRMHSFYREAGGRTPELWVPGVAVFHERCDDCKAIPEDWEGFEECVFPDMSARQRVALGHPRSGIILAVKLP